ncbi:MAG: ferrochelatase, partial [bacterium]
LTTTASALNEVKRVLKKINYHPRIAYVNRWCEHSLYLDALAQRVKKGIGEFEPDVQDEVRIIFSAHSIPERCVRKGDPYPQDVTLTVRGVLERARINNKWYIAYQSRTGRVRWLSPAVDELILNLIGEGARSFLIVPVSFVSDHFETLYEIDILLADKVRSAGGVLHRTESLNASDDFIGVLGQLVMDALFK